MAGETTRIPATVLAEVCYWLNTHGEPELEAAFLDAVADDMFRLVDLRRDDVARMAELRWRSSAIKPPGVGWRLRRRPVVVLERIGPAETRKSGKVAVVGADLGPVFDRQRSELYVGGEVARGALGVQQVEGDVEVSWSGQQEPGPWASQPLPDEIGGVADRERVGQDAGVGGDAEEAEQGR